MSELTYYQVSDVGRAKGLSVSGVRYRVRRGVLRVAARTLSGTQLFLEPDVVAQEPPRRSAARSSIRANAADPVPARHEFTLGRFTADDTTGAAVTADRAGAPRALGGDLRARDCRGHGSAGRRWGFCAWRAHQPQPPEREIATADGANASGHDRRRRCGGVRAGGECRIHGG